MKAEDLMIGDWVVGGSEEPFKIGIIDPDFLHWNEIQPIPLTPEILEKNGFSENYREEDLSYAQSCGDVIGIHIYGTNGLMEEMYFKYVHELQHALRLCGIEKEIEL